MVFNPPDTTGVALWWLQDAEFREKRVNIRCAIESQFNTSDVTLAAALELYATMVTYLLQSQLYAPKEVGYDYTVSATPRGLQLKLTGLSDPDNMAAFVATVASGELPWVLSLCGVQAHLSTATWLNLSCVCVLQGWWMRGGC